ncbi:MAG: hypothetical protein ABI664_10245 [bacterium]
MRVLGVLSLFALSACASSGGTSSRPDETVRIVGAGSSNLKLTSNTYAHVTRIAAPVDRVWLAMPGAFEALSIPISAVDSLDHSIANDGLKLRRQLGKTPLSRFIDCGSTQIGENADSYDVHFTIRVQLKPEEGGMTKLETMFEAMAKPVSFSRDYSRCTTRGVLETRLADAVKAQLAQ